MKDNMDFETKLVCTVRVPSSAGSIEVAGAIAMGKAKQHLKENPITGVRVSSKATSIFRSDNSPNFDYYIVELALEEIPDIAREEKIQYLIGSTFIAEVKLSRRYMFRHSFEETGVRTAHFERDAPFSNQEPWRYTGFWHSEEWSMLTDFQVDQHYRNAVEARKRQEWF